MSGQRSAARRSLSVAKRCVRLAALSAMVAMLSGCVLDPRLWACFLGGGGDFTPCINAIVNPQPDAPAGLTAEAAPDGILLRWESPENGAEFRISRATAAAGPFVSIGSAKHVPPDRPSFLDRGAEPSVRYFYTVRTIKDDVVGIPTPAVSAIWRRAPTGLTAIAGAGEVALDWDDSAGSDLAGYNVYGGKSGTLAKLNDTPLQQSQYTAKGLEGDVAYGFQVRALYPEGESPPSAPVSSTPVGSGGPPAAPTGLQATPGEEKVVLDWADNAEPDLAGYYVYVAFSDGGAFNQIGRGLVASSNFTHIDLANGSTYYYRVTAVDTGDLESAPSEIVLATPCAGCRLTLLSAEAASSRTAKRPRKSPRKKAQAFRLSLSGSYGGGGKTRRRGGVVVVTGLEFTGSFTLKSGGSVLRGTWRSRADWRVRPNARQGTASGVALATFSNRKVGVACLRFSETQKPAKRGKKVETRGTLTLLGGTARAASMLGRGSYAAAVGARGTVVYRGKLRPARGTKRLPRACIAMRR